VVSKHMGGSTFTVNLPHQRRALAVDEPR